LKQRKPLLALIPIALFLGGWELSAALGWTNPALFPPPTRIVGTLADLYAEGLPVHSMLLLHIGATLQRVLLAVAAGVLLGVILGVLMGISRPVKMFFDPLITVLMPIPGIALAPLFIVWFGFGDVTIVTLGIISAFFPVVYSTMAGVRSVDRQMVRAARIMGASRLKTITAVYLPWAAGYVFNGIKIGLARCWMTVIAVEFVAATNYGLGYMIWDAAEFLRADVVYGGIILLIVIYFIMEKVLVRTLEKRTIERWGMVRNA